MAAGRVGRPFDRRQGVRVLSQMDASARAVGTYVRAARTDAAATTYAAFPSVLRRRRTLTHANPTPTPMTTIIQNTTEPPFELVWVPQSRCLRAPPGERTRQSPSNGWTSGGVPGRDVFGSYESVSRLQIGSAIHVAHLSANQLSAVSDRLRLSTDRVRRAARESPGRTADGRSHWGDSGRCP
jgi:hypothetical protein